jgi:hypothetical protein
MPSAIFRPKTLPSSIELIRSRDKRRVVELALLLSASKLIDRVCAGSGIRTYHTW